MRSGGLLWPTKAGEMCHLQARTDTADNWEECQQAPVLASPAFPKLGSKGHWLCEMLVIKQIQKLSTHLLPGGQHILVLNVSQ